MRKGEIVTKVIQTVITQEEWYTAFMEECKAIVVEGEFTSRWALVECYHQLGKRVLEEYRNFERRKIYGAEIAKRVSQSIDRDKRTVEKAVQFAKKYPDLDKVPGGKAISWRVICNELLPQPKQGKCNTPELPSGKYSVIYADPPWQYDFSLTDNRKIENQYPTMAVDDICSLPIADIENEDCVLLMWATSPKLVEAMQVIKAWGFTYKTCAVWVKDKIGMGYYFRQQHELLLVATKGNPPIPEPESRVSSIIQAPRLEHSAKPEVVYSIIDAMYPNIQKVELFARSNGRVGWMAWGNQI